MNELDYWRRGGRPKLRGTAEKVNGLIEMGQWEEFLLSMQWKYLGNNGVSPAENETPFFAAPFINCL